MSPSDLCEDQESDLHSSGRSAWPQCLQKCGNSFGSAFSKRLQKGQQLDQGWLHSGHRSKTNCERSNTLVPSRRSTTKRHFGFVQIKKHSMQVALRPLSFCWEHVVIWLVRTLRDSPIGSKRSFPPWPLGGGLISRPPHPWTPFWHARTPPTQRAQQATPVCGSGLQRFQFRALPLALQAALLLMWIPERCLSAAICLVGAHEGRLLRGNTNIQGPRRRTSHRQQ